MTNQTKETFTFFAGSSKISPYYLPKYGDDVIQLAIQIDLDAVKYQPILSRFLNQPNLSLTKFHYFKQAEPLSSIIKDLCIHWKLEESAICDFALKLKGKDDRDCKYITESNRYQEVKKGENILLFTVSPASLCKTLLTRIFDEESCKDEKSLEEALKILSDYCCDQAIVDQLIEDGGCNEIIKLIESGKLANLSSTSGHLLTVFWRIMEIGSKTWDEISEKLIHEVALFVNGQLKIVNPKTTCIALMIVEAICANSSKFDIIQREVPIDNLVILLFNSDYKVQCNTLAVMNTIFAKCDPTSKEQVVKLLKSASVRTPILNNILRDHKIVPGAELSHQLHVLQRNMVNTYDLRLKASLQPNSTDYEKIHELTRLAFEKALSPNINRKNLQSKQQEFMKLGFKNVQYPADDIEDSGTGLLGLDCMIYFATRHHQNFFKIILDNTYRNGQKECPFAQTSLLLVKVLIEICKIEQPPSEEGHDYRLLFFTHDYPFEELFSVAIILLNKTWKEMKANIDEDLTKVTEVVREQILRTLQKQQYQTFKSFEQETKSFPYGEIAKLWEQELAEKEENEFSLPCIVRLEELLRPRMENLVRMNRLSALKDGQEFAKYGRGQKSTREKGKFWFWGLASSEKSLIFAECKEKERPEVDQMTDSINIEDIAEIRTSSDCPHIKELVKSKSKITCEFAFSIILKNSPLEECYNFVACDVHTFNVWIDGLNALLELPMTSPSAFEQIQAFTNLNVKIRLMQLEECGVYLLRDGESKPIMPSNAPPPLVFLNNKETKNN